MTMTQEIIKDLSKYGAASLIAIYLVYVLANSMAKEIKELKDGMLTLNDHMEDSVIIQTQMVRSIEENSRLLRSQLADTR